MASALSNKKASGEGGFFLLYMEKYYSAFPSEPSTFTILWM